MVDHTSVRRVRATGARLLSELQRQRLEVAVGRPSGYVVLRVMWDETKFDLHMAPEGVASRSTFLTHGLIEQRCQEELLRQELIMAPQVLQSTTANGLCAAVDASIPLSLAQIFSQAERACLQLTTNAHSTNVKVAKHLHAHAREGLSLAESLRPNARQG